MINFRELEVFWAVYSNGSIKRAAQALSVTQPAVSMMLRNAEGRFGLKLFQRIGARVEPTEEAKVIASLAERVFLGLGEIEAFVDETRRARLDFIRVAAAPTFATQFLPAAIASFRLTHPEIYVILRMVPTPQVLDLVAAREVDLGVAYAPAPAGAAHVHQQHLATAEIRCVLRRDHPLARKRQIGVSDLTNETVISYRPDTPLGAALVSALRAAGAELAIGIQATAPNAVAMVAGGQGAALIDPFVLRGTGHRDLVARTFRPTTSAPVVLFTSPGTSLAPICKTFSDEVTAGLENAVQPSESGAPAPCC